MIGTRLTARLLIQIEPKLFSRKDGRFQRGCVSDAAAGSAPQPGIEVGPRHKSVLGLFVKDLICIHFNSTHMTCTQSSQGETME